MSFITLTEKNHIIIIIIDNEKSVDKILLMIEKKTQQIRIKNKFPQPN